MSAISLPLWQLRSNKVGLFLTTGSQQWSHQAGTQQSKRASDASSHLHLRLAVQS